MHIIIYLFKENHLHLELRLLYSMNYLIKLYRTWNNLDLEN
jgi:hypothetical protein